MSELHAALAAHLPPAHRPAVSAGQRAACSPLARSTKQGPHTAAHLRALQVLVFMQRLPCSASGKPQRIGLAKRLALPVVVEGMQQVRCRGGWPSTMLPAVAAHLRTPLLVRETPCRRAVCTRLSAQMAATPAAASRACPCPWAARRAQATPPRAFRCEKLACAAAVCLHCMMCALLQRHAQAQILLLLLPCSWAAHQVQVWAWLCGSFRGRVAAVAAAAATGTVQPSRRCAPRALGAGA